MSGFRNIVILTGAGISAESAIDTFRDKGGIWSRFNVEDVATPQGFARNPALVQDFYNARRRGLTSVQPNAAHFALAKLEREFGGDVLLVTQNIDNLHERGGSTRIIHMHGELNQVLCTACEMRSEWHADVLPNSTCPRCHTVGYLRPDVVWFGEMPYQMNTIDRAIRGCDLFLSIGTSGNVYPAAGFVAEARQAGAHTVELNLEPSEGFNLFEEAHHGRATELVPAFVEQLLA